MTTYLVTKNLDLSPCTVDDLQHLIASHDAYRAATGIQVAPGYLEFPEALTFTLDKLNSVNEADRPWWTPYLFIHRADRTLMGLGGYKGPPMEGTVEIGYGVAHAYRNRGLATEAVEALLAHALEQPNVGIVLAHTLAQPNASSRVLEKAGFSKVAEIEDPDDGPVWRWEYKP